MAGKALASAATRPSLVRSFGYVVGPAYGLLLDRAGGSWRPAALRNRALPDLLAARIGMPKAANGEGYGEATIRREEAERAKTLAEKLAILRSRLVDGPTVTIPLVEMSISFNPNTLTPLPGFGSSYAGASVQDRWGKLEAKGPVLLNGDWSRIVLPGPARIDGNRLIGPDWEIDLASKANFDAANPNRATLTISR